MSDVFIDSDDKAVPITAVDKRGLKAWLKDQDERIANWVAATGFRPRAGRSCLVPDKHGELAHVLVGKGEGNGLWDYAGLASTLPQGSYRIATKLNAETASLAALGWGLGTYKFDRYKEATKKERKLIWPKAADKTFVNAARDATFLVRTLINTPAEDMGPEQLSAAAKEVADAHGAEFAEIVGEDLLRQGYPAVHAIGRASSRPPRLIDIRWGDEKDPKVTLVGKGVCFDTGGLDLKQAAGMLRMKKDMGGGAHALGVAKMIMATGLKARIRVLVPAVENSVSGNALRPLDIIKTRKGLTVEIGNTDAEGRVILSDALAEGASESPDLMIDFATLTGAARVALGPDLPAFFCNDEAFAAEFLAAGVDVGDPVWRMPLWPGYRTNVESKTADLTNAPEGGFAGAITAALFLERFAAPVAPWVHLDIMAWNASNRPGRPEGGDAISMRAAYEAIKRRLES